MFKRIFVLILVLLAVLAAGWLAMRRSDIPFTSLESRYSTDESEFLTLPGGLVVHYKDQGDLNAPVLLLVHGFTSSTETWSEWVPGLTEDYRVISVDLPGHGLTRVQENTDFSTAGLVEFLKAFSEALRLETFTLAGSSMGGHAAWVYALDHESTLDALVLVDAAGLPIEEGVPQPDTPFIIKLIRNPVARALIEDLDPGPMLRNGLARAYHDQSFVTEDLVQRYSDYARAPGHRHTMMQLSARDPEEEGRRFQELSELSLSVLILQGREDRLVAATDAERFHTLIPGSELIIYENVGHMPHEEHAAESLSDLRSFLAGVYAPEASEEPPAEETVAPL